MVFIMDYMLEKWLPEHILRSPRYSASKLLCKLEINKVTFLCIYLCKILIILHSLNFGFSVLQ